MSWPPRLPWPLAPCLPPSWAAALPASQHLEPPAATAQAAPWLRLNFLEPSLEAKASLLPGLPPSGHQSGSLPAHHARAAEPLLTPQPQAPAGPDGPKTAARLDQTPSPHRGHRAAPPSAPPPRIHALGPGSNADRSAHTTPLARALGEALSYECGGGWRARPQAHRQEETPWRVAHHTARWWR